jgi:hypothetical protein
MLNPPQKEMLMTDPHDDLNYRRLTALAADIKQFAEQFADQLSEEERYLLHDIHAQMRGMAALIGEDNVYRVVNIVVQSAINEYVPLMLRLDKSLAK